MDMTYDQSSVIQAIQTLIPASAAVIAIITFKKDNNGLLALKQAIKLGVGVFLVAGIIGLAYFTLFINFIEPDFISNTAALQADALREAQPTLDEDIIEMQQTNTEKFFYISYPVILILNVFLGLIVGLLTGLFTKKS
jgi:predicted ABC-type sugar transport system permease subunit